MGHLVRNFADKGRANRSLVPFGWGDGGGGPTREMIGRAARLAPLPRPPRAGTRWSGSAWTAFAAIT